MSTFRVGIMGMIVLPSATIEINNFQILDLISRHFYILMITIMQSNVNCIIIVINYYHK